ncbi:hypothetical protein AKJ51_01100 [candidate division MSBL1 archaeon SCGC-AAA382A20]|uniref:RNase H type-1 domain-containing protein n=1 Tax=candidate division MSBL1 archaeon SCGC-AAA382A20 TaxID=1698280 RepID=A0A133VM82_9EURY|nr:hypothetical protein AKJ51_01100 [candidate division MSBL1 archaeon SCGC-AAA382A20]
MVLSVVAHIDGASRGNPGPAGIGVLIKTEEKNLSKISEYMGDEYTNNQAEYKALVRCLERCKELKVEKAKILSDSNLLVNQMNGKYDVKSDNIKNLYNKAKKLESKFKKIKYEHIPREKNKIADNLANKSIEEELN